LKKTKKFISLLLAVCVVVSTLPVFALPASAATAGAPKGDSTVFSALGIDTTATPDGYDAASTKNPYGKDRVTVSPVSELYVETALEHNSRAGALYGDGLASGKTSADFYEDGNSHIATAKGSFSAYRSVAGNFTGNGRNGQIATVAANESSGGVYLYFSDPKGMWDGRDKTLLQSGSALGNPSAGSLENFADAHVGTRVAVADVAGNRLELKVGVSGVAKLARVVTDAAGTHKRTHGAKVERLLSGQKPNALQTAVDGRVVQECFCQLLQIPFHIRENAEEFANHIVIHILALAADFIHGKNYAAAGGILKHIQHLFAHSPCFHEQAFKAKRVGKQTKP